MRVAPNGRRISCGRIHRLRKGTTPPHVPAGNACGAATIGQHCARRARISRCPRPEMRVVPVRLRQLSLVFLLATGAAPGAMAQVGSTTDIITGTVTGPDSLPLAGAQVQAISIETQVSRQRT